MKLSSLISPEAVMPGLGARTVREAIPEILDRAENLHPKDAADRLIEAVLRREAQASTAMASGIAIPHARVSDLHDFYLLLGIPERPLEDKGLDGFPVEWVFLIAANDQKNTMLLQTMAAIGAFAQDPERLGALRDAGSREAIWGVIDASDVRVKKGLYARDLMREAPVVAGEDMPLRELLDQFFEKSVHEAPVCTPSGQIVGVVTTEEIIEAGFPGYMSRIPQLDFLSEFEPFEQFFRREATTRVGSVLNRTPLVVDADDPMIQVVFRLKQSKRHFAYVQEQGRLVGVIYRNDIVSRILRV